MTRVPTSRFRFTSGHVLGAVLLGGVFVYLAGYPLWYTDIWAHAKYGEWYWQHAAMPGVEPLSPFSDREAAFADVAWLSQVVYYGLYEMGAGIAGGDAASRLRGGAEALRSFHLLLLIARLTLLWLALRRFGGSSAWALVGLGLYVMAVGFGSAVQRPQAFGLFLVVLVIYALSSPALSRRAAIGLPMAFCLWANLHGTFVVGLAVLGLHTLGRAVERGTADREVRRLAIVGMACFLATFVNPHGPFLYKQVIAFSGHPNLKTMTEWQPMQLSAGGGNHWPYLMSLVLLAFVRILGGRKIGVAGLLVALPFAVWPWFQVRSLLWWWSVCVWLLARVGPGLGERFPTMPAFPDGEPSRAKAWMTLGIVAASSLAFPPLKLALLGIPRDLDHTVSAGTPWRLALELTAVPADEGRWLPELRKELRGRYPNGQYSGAVFASETQGDFLIWSLPADIPVLMYTHAHVFTPAHWQDCMAVRRGDSEERNGPTGWSAFLDRNRVNLIIVETGTHAELTAILRKDKEWQVVWEEPPFEEIAGVRTDKFIALCVSPR